MTNRPSWAKAVKERDGKRCRFCGVTERLEAHHMIPVSKNPELSLDVRNGITLCHKHHRIAHHGKYDGMGRSCIMQNRDWFTDESLAEMDAFIYRAIQEAMKECT